MRRDVAGHTDFTEKAREQYAWAITNIEAGLGAIPLSRPDRDDVAEWLDELVAGDRLSRRGQVRVIEGRVGPVERMRDSRHWKCLLVLSNDGV